MFGDEELIGLGELWAGLAVEEQGGAFVALRVDLAGGEADG